MGIKPQLVCRIMQLVKPSLSKLKSLIQKNRNKSQKIHLIHCAVEKKLGSGHHIWKAKDVQKMVQESSGTSVTLPEVRKVFKRDFGLRYKLIKRVPFHGNTPRCLVLRQLYAKAMLGALSSGKRVINIDETWIPHTDFRRKKWRAKGDNNSVPLKSLGFRVNMIAAVDTEGNVYLTLT